MNTKEFTLREGFILPILKSLYTLSKESSIDEILKEISDSKLLSPTEYDLETIDFNGKVRYKNVIESVINSLIDQGLIVVSNNLYLLSDEGIKRIENDSLKYSQSNYLRKYEINDNNSDIFANIPSYLLHSGNRHSFVGEFPKHEDSSIKLLNSFIDYIDSNYPTIEEMINFLKSTFNLKDDSEGLEIINTLRSASLIKIIGKNLCLTKLGQWYENSYSNITLFKIFANKHTGFEEMFFTVGQYSAISIISLKQVLLSKYNLEWANTHQFNVRINWLKDMGIIKQTGQELSLTDKSLDFAILLGVTQSPGTISTEHEHEMSSDLDDIDEIIDDLIQESVSNELESLDNFDEGINIKIHSENFNKNINLSEQERNFLLNSVNVDGEIFTDNLDNEKDGLDEVPAQNEETVSNVIQIPTKHFSDNKIENQSYNTPENNQFIHPDEINSLINLPKEISSKIASALNMGKHLILTGPQGSGKTSIAVVLAKIANKKQINNGYILTTANKNWTSVDTIGNLIQINNNENIFKEGYILKSIREDKWLLIDEINNCDTRICFNDFINSFYGHNTILSYTYSNYKNIEIIGEPEDIIYDENQYVKNKNWRMIATLDYTDTQKIDFTADFIRRFAFIDIGVNNYTNLIDEYFLKNNLHNDLLKTKIKTIFSESGLLKYNVGASSIHDLIQYISIRSNLITQNENMQDILAEGLELYILPQLRILDQPYIKEVQSYLLGLFEGYENIKKYITKAL